MSVNSAPGPMMELLGRIAYEIQIMRPLFPTYIHLIVSAIFPIFTAAHAALARPSSAASVKKAKSSSGTEDEDEDAEPSPQVETLSPSDAILFPIMAGCTLATLYFILKALEDPAWLNYLLGLYFGAVGFFFATRFVKDGLSVMRSIALPQQYTFGGQSWNVSEDNRHFKSLAGDNQASPLPGIFRMLPLPNSVRTRIWALRQIVYKKAQLEFKIHNIIHFKSPVDVLDVFSIMLSSVIVWYHTFIDKPWFLTNILGFSFCYGSLQFMTPGTSWTGTLLLCALFFYDIYFVFFTPMMVTVATKLDVPIKLLFPRPDGCIMPVGAGDGSAEMEEYLRCLAKKRTMAMLGLGDIVIPGMMLAFALRFDLYLFYLRMKPDRLTTQDDKAEKQKPTYSSATGSWGERIWTGKSFHSRALRLKQFPKVYFYATSIGYVIGMIVTVVVMQVFQHAQPALLYLVPGVLISLWGTALVRGELKILWNFSEVPEDEEAKDGKAKSKTNSKQIEGSRVEEAKEIPKQQKEGTQDGGSLDLSSRNTISNHNDDEATKQSEAQASTTTVTDEKSKTTVNQKSDASPHHIIYFAITLPNPKIPRPNNQEKSKAKDDDDDTKEQGSASDEHPFESSNSFSDNDDDDDNREPTILLQKSGRVNDDSRSQRSPEKKRRKL